MTDRFSDRHLETVLISVGHHLDVPIPPDADPAVLAAEPGRWGSRGRWALAAAAVIVVVTLVAVVPPARTAVARLLGLGSTQVEVVPDGSVGDGSGVSTAELPGLVDGLDELSTAEAERRLRQALPDAASTPLGEPDAIHAVPEGGVLLSWRQRETTLWIRRSTVEPPSLLVKLIGDGADAVAVDGLGDGALLIRGDHVLLTPYRRVASATVVLWIEDGDEYRLEADGTDGEVIDLARALSAAG